MLKIEYIWRELLYRTIEEKKNNFTLTDLSLKFKLSTSVVSHALFPLREIGMVKIGKNKSQVIDTERLLMYWATRRSVKKDIIYQTHSSLPVLAREASMPHGVFPTAYSGFAYYKKDPPADYENIYYYTECLDEVIKRFPQNNKKPNLFILATDPYHKIYLHTSLSQIFVDLWNLPEWYAKEFSQEALSIVKERIGL
ncbi:hypothetical protein COY90_03535 [Candidatus Roizmanbacteria bacterium CG_4_10_14_0_8_um_filter_39_9]|uniref:Uncharacterized protein n=1 Tax=Candidatus Roizmanbacteria bacterium CG_4_10_14_0_8_um_filter_39_9 TaxID=1974829 RepID=A0A2M7QCE3_9BACT|nr:MAG: hypothetical protein COY90_03535 [Candidatus Roizmanbacteria bacterium CG_4_10_14_0_8_um_filter_39_9]